MARRDRHFWLKVLIGLVFAMLVVDVLALICVVVPLAASQQKRAEPAAFSPRLTRSAVDQALILPTHDPRKPWPTRTPRPTATPWLIARATLTPGRLATSGPPGNSAPMPSNAAGFRVTPGASGAAAPATPSPTVEAVRPTGAPGPTLTSPAAGEGTVTPTPEMRPAETLVAPADTPSPTPLPDTPEPSPSIVPGDFAQFTAYVEDHYNSIAGQPLEIGAVSLLAVGADIPVVTVEVVGDGMNSVLAQTPDAVLDYGRRLLDDTKLYFDGQPFAINVVSIYDTSDPGACYNNPSWCTVGERNRDDSRWSIAWIYVQGTSARGSDSVEIWNQSP